jgi:hypothetical protein
MNPIVEDSNRRFEFAKSLLDKARQVSDRELQRSFSEMAIAASFSCLEGMLTHIFDHFKEDRNFDIFEQSIMQEKVVKLARGQPCLGDQRFQSIDDRVQFLFWKFSGEEFDKGRQWWSEFANAVHLRNCIMHPKDKSEISAQDAERAIVAVIAALDDLMFTVFSRRWPKAMKGTVPSFTI